MGVCFLIVMLLTSGIVFAKPEVDSATTNLQGALIPGSEVVFTAKGTPDCTAMLSISIRANGSSTPLTWSSPMQEEEDGVYVFRWTPFDNMDTTLISATVELTDRGGEKSSTRSAIGSPVATGGSVRGKVFDALSGVPLPDIQVIAYSPSTRHFAAAKSNQRGEYTLVGLGPSSDYRLWTVNDQGFSDSKRESVYVSRGSTAWSVDMALTGLSAVSGYLEDETGAPLSGVTVTAEQQGGVRRRESVTDERGRYTIAGLVAGSCDLRATWGSTVASANVEIISGRLSSTDFRLSPQRLVASCEVYLSEASSHNQVTYWPRQGGPVRTAVVSEVGTATLENVMMGEELILSLQADGQPPKHFSLSPTDGQYPTRPSIYESLLTPNPLASLTLTPPLVTRGGSAMLSGRAEGSEWVDIWLDSELQGRFPVLGGQWLTSLSLADGDHTIVAMTVGSNPLKVERHAVVDRLAPAVSLVAINGQTRPSWLSGDGGGEFYAGPNEAITIALVTDQPGTTNWLTIGERRLPMSSRDNTLTVTIPAPVMVAGEYLLSWGYELQGKKGEVAVGSLNVRKPIILSVIDALTGESITEVNASIEQQTENGWIMDPVSQVEERPGKVDVWLATGEGSRRLVICQPGYHPSVTPLDESPVEQGLGISLMPVWPNGPVSLNPARDIKMELGGSITVTFARDLDPASVDGRTFYIRGMDSQMTFDPLTRKATLQPLSRLGENSYYLVHLSGSIRYADGTPMGHDVWWLLNTSEVTKTEDRSSASRLAAPGQAAVLVPRDSGAKITVPTGSSPIQTLYRLTRPAVLPKELPRGWKAIAAPLDFSATNSPLDRPIQRLQQGVEVSIFYTDPPAEGQSVTLWRYEPSILNWIEQPYDHDPYLRTVRFTTDRPGLFVFAKK